MFVVLDLYNFSYDLKDLLFALEFEPIASSIPLVFSVKQFGISM